MPRTIKTCLLLLLLGPAGESVGLGGDFSLTADDGSTYSLHDSRGKAVVLSFGYTFCPDVCPTALNTIAIALNRLEPEQARRVDALFVSLDPDRDSPERLREYTRYFHPQLFGLTGTDEQLRSVTERFNVRYNFVGKGEKVHYSVDHSASLYVIDPHGRLMRILPHGLPPQALVESLRAALARFSAPDRPAQP